MSDFEGLSENEIQVYMLLNIYILCLNILKFYLFDWELKFILVI